MHQRQTRYRANRHRLKRLSKRKLQSKSKGRVKSTRQSRLRPRLKPRGTWDNSQVTRTTKARIGSSFSCQMEP